MEKDEFNFFEETKIIGGKLLALLFLESSRQLESKDEIVANLPLSCREHFEKLQKLRDFKESFFYRFIVFKKPENQGLLVGFGNDETYYALAAWNDKGKVALWEPRITLKNSPSNNN
jgi:hypothetical protein